MCTSHTLAGAGWRYAGGNRGSAWSGSRQCAAAASPVSTAESSGKIGAKELGWTSTRSIDAGARGGVFGAVDQASQGREDTGRLLASRRLCAKPRPTGGGHRGVSDVGAPWLAQGRAGHPAPKGRPEGTAGLEKKLPKVLANLIGAEPVKPRRVRLMFQDEARFGRMVRINLNSAVETGI